MTDSEDDSILENIQRTRELWSTKAGTGSTDCLIPKSPISQAYKSPPPAMENHVNGHHVEEDVIRFEDQVEEDFDLPDVKSLKSQWEKAGPIPTPKKQTPAYERQHTNNLRRENSTELVPVNRDVEEPEENYEVQLGKLREKFEKEAKKSKMKKTQRRSYKMQNICAKFEGGKFTSKLTFRLAASSSKVVWNDMQRSSISKAAVDQRVSRKKKHASVNKAPSSKQTASDKRFEAEIEAQKVYNGTKENTVEMPTVELSSIKQQFEQRKYERIVTPLTPSKRKQRETSSSSDISAPATDIIKYDDTHEEDVKYEIELSSIRKKFEQSSNQSRPYVKSYLPSSAPQKAVGMTNTERVRASSESENIAKGDVVKSSEAKYDQMIGEESVKDRLARYKAMTEESKKSSGSQKFSYKAKQKKAVVDVATEKVEEEVVSKQQDIVRSPPAGTKEVPEYTTSVDLQQAKSVFEQSPSRSSRSSRSSSASPQRRSPRSQSTPSPINRGSRHSSATSSKSPSPVREPQRSSGSSSRSSLSSGRGSPQPAVRAKKVPKKVGDPDVVVLEHSEVNFYYEDGKRLSTKVKGLEDTDREIEEDMSNTDVVRPQPAGTKEEVDYVPSVNMHSVRDMFENPKEDQVRGRAPPPKKTIIVERQNKQSDSSGNNSPERNPDIVRSTTAGSREEPDYKISVDLKSARSKFESPQRPEVYVPRNTIQKREEEARQRRAAAAAASPRSSESSDASFEVVKTTEAGYREKPEYHVDMNAAKNLFEGGSVPKPVKSVKEKFEHQDEHEDEDEEAKRKSPIDIQQEARMVVRKEQEVKEEVKKNEEEMAKAESSSDSESDTEGEVVLERDSSENDAAEVAADPVPEKTASVSSSSSEEELVKESEEPAAAVVPVRVAITEDLTEKEPQETAEEPEAQQQYETYTKVVDYQEDIQQQTESTSGTESDSDKEAASNHIQEEQPSYDEVKEVYTEQEILTKDDQQEVEINDGHGNLNDMNDSGQRSSSSSSDEEEPQVSLSSSSLQEKGGNSSSAEEEGEYLQ